MFDNNGSGPNASLADYQAADGSRMTVGQGGQEMMGSMDIQEKNSK